MLDGVGAGMDQVMSGPVLPRLWPPPRMTGKCSTKFGFFYVNDNVSRDDVVYTIR